MAYFPHAYQKLLVGTAGFATSGLTTALTAGQIGVIDATTNTAQNIAGTPTYAATPLVYLAQGSFHTVDKLGPYHGGYQETVKSKGINPKYVSAFYVTTPATAINNIQNICVHDCTGIACDTTYRLRIDVKGSPALRFLTHNIYQTVDAYSGCCDADSNNIDPNVLLLQWMDAINASPIISKFVSAKVWSNVSPATALTATNTALAGVTISARNGIVAGDKVVFTPLVGSSATASSISGDVFTVGTAATNSLFSVGQVLIGSGVTTGTTIVSRVSGTGGTGSVFKVSISQTVASATITSVTPLITFVISSHVATTGAGNLLLVAADTITTPSATAIGNVTTSSTAVTVFHSITTATYTATTGATVPNTNEACLELSGAYVDTVFGNCSFSPMDQYELEPVQIYASAVDELDNLCSTKCFTFSEVQATYQGKGYGESLVRELILSKSYQQEPYQHDPRMREVLDDTTLTDIVRGSKYFVYHILHSVPRKSNSSGMLDNDQYLIKVVVSSRTTNFETYMNTLLTSSGNAVQLVAQL